ncbi:MAG TPA: hypothetical protein VFL95_07010 [Gemmatimonadales bacterium]|nr:hypothetical protein [Gemmatimonadales bacterium]
MFAKEAARRAAFVSAMLLMIGLAACGDDDPTSPQEEQLAKLRAAVLPFHDLTSAQQAGYTVVVAHPTSGATCISDPQLGAMGIHYLNTALVDDTVIVTQPELMIYEPQEDGTAKFVAVEYIIPFSIRGEDQPAPTLFGETFKQNETFGVWALHAWVGEDNPSGTFSDWNPDVSCANAQ